MLERRIMRARELVDFTVGEWLERVRWMALWVRTFLGEGLLVGEDTLELIGEIEDLAQDEVVEV
jgi:hypothetical protein